MPNRATAAQVRGLLRGAAKDDELRRTGFDQFLAEAGDTQSPMADARMFLREDAVEVEEARLGEDPNHGLDQQPRDERRPLSAG
jgi:hypothetical protein